MSKCKLPDHGYTPANFSEFVLYSGLKNAEFMARFNIKRATFYCYKSGKFNPDWRYWLELKLAVERYKLNECLKLPRLE